MEQTTVTKKENLMLSQQALHMQKLINILGTSLLLLITSLSSFAVLFIFYFIAKDALPFFAIEGIKEFFTSTEWYPSAEEANFGCLSIFIGSGLVTLGAIVVAVPIGISASVCLSDILPFKIRQIVKPIVEILAAIPSVAYGFFALVVFAPALQNNGNALLSIAGWIICAPLFFIGIVVLSDLIADKWAKSYYFYVRIGSIFILLLAAGFILINVHTFLNSLEISSGTNALNVSIVLGIMALPTIISVSEDALQACGRELREGSYSLGATRVETIFKTVIPAAMSGIFAAIILGIMRAIGETMVVWMASGNAAQIPQPWYNFLDPVRTLTATIAGDMGEADHVTGSARYHVLFAMALCLLIFSFGSNLLSEWIVSKQQKKLGLS
ncbi:MAG: PstC family ABC transporter permease [Chitinispirillia bacterium]|jgi:phosphate transport system permease protein